MSVIITFDSDYFAGKINGFEKARKYYSNSKPNKRQESKLPTKVKITHKMIIIKKCNVQVNNAVLNSDQVANANVFLSKKDSTDPELKKKIVLAKVEHLNAIKKFLVDGSATLKLEFVEKRVTRKRSGKYKNVLRVNLENDCLFKIKQWRLHMFREEHSE